MGKTQRRGPEETGHAVQFQDLLDPEPTRGPIGMALVEVVESGPCLFTAPFRVDPGEPAEVLEVPGVGRFLETRQDPGPEGLGRLGGVEDLHHPRRPVSFELRVIGAVVERGVEHRRVVDQLAATADALQGAAEAFLQGILIFGWCEGSWGHGGGARKIVKGEGLSAA